MSQDAMSQRPSVSREHQEGEQPGLTNRQMPFSEAFKQFICADWAPYSDQLPAPLPASRPAQRRREAISAMFPGERLIIPAGGLKTRNNDCDYRFRPHSAFAHLSGLGTDREPNAVLVLEPAGATGHESRLYFHPRVPRTDPEFYSSPRYGEMWVGQRESLAEMAALCGVPTFDIATLNALLVTDVPTRIVRDADPELTAKVDVLREQNRVGADDELARTLSELRFVKDDFELDQLRQACQATAHAFEGVVRELPRALAKGRGERWVEGVFDLYARHEGNGVGYETIAASGDHANTLHWINNDADLHEGDLILIDAGVEMDSLYTADVTRTLPISGHFSPAQRRVYDAVLAAQAAGFSAAKPGNTFGDVHAAAIASLAHTFADWGILPVSAEEALDPTTGGQYRRWMVHGTSHHLGLDVHDCALASRETYQKGILQPGMVITVEPGIYFKSTDLLVPEELRGIGVRIEDDVVITANGCEILSHQLPRTAEDVESWMAGLRPSA